MKEKHIYSIRLYANLLEKSFECRKVGDAFNVEERLHQHENAVTQRLNDMLGGNVKIPGKRDYDIHEILKNDTLIQWDGESNEGYFTGREVFYMKDYSDPVYIDQVVLNWALNKIHPIDDFTKRENWRKSEEGFDLNRIQRRIIKGIVNKFLRGRKTEGRLKHLLEAVPRSGKSAMSLFIAKELGFKNILIITPFPDADGSFKTITELHPSLPNSTFKDVRIDFKNQTIGFHNKSKDGLDVIMTSWANLNLDKEKFNTLFNSQIDFVIIDEIHRQSDSIRSEKMINEFYKNNICLPILHLSGTPYNDKIAGRFTKAETTTYDLIDKLRDVVKYRGILEKGKFLNENERKEFEYIASFPDIKFIIVDRIKEAFEKAQVEFDIENNSPLDNFISNPDPKYKTARKFFFEGLVPNKKDFLQKFGRTHIPLLEKFENEFNQILMFLENNSICDMIKLELEELCNNPESGWNGYHIKSISGREEKDDYGSLEKDINTWQKEYPKLIILSVGKATTGLTMKRLSSVWIMRKMRSAELFTQIALRLGTPFKGKDNTNVVVFDSEAIITAQMVIAKVRAMNNSESFERIFRELNDHIPLLLDDGISYEKIDADIILSIGRKIAQRAIRKLSQTDFNVIDIDELKELANLAGIDPSKIDQKIGMGGQRTGAKFTARRNKNNPDNENKDKEEVSVSRNTEKAIIEGIEFILNHLDWIIPQFNKKIESLKDMTNLSKNDFDSLMTFEIKKKKYKLTKSNWNSIVKSIDNELLEEAIFQTNIKLNGFKNDFNYITND